MTVKRGIGAALCSASALALALAAPAGANAQDVTELRWATSSVGSAGHSVKVNLMAMLNREWDGYSITVLPTAGAVATVRGYAMGEFDGYYGADIAFQELAEDRDRFQGFRDQMDRQPVQSFWAYTMEVGLAVRAEDQEGYGGWRGLEGSPVFTGPAPWDVRAQLERAMNALEVGHEYTEIDLGIAGSSLSEGTIDGFIAYTSSEASVAPWVSEAMLSSDSAILNPSDEEVEMLAEAGIEVVSVDPGVFDADTHVDEVMLVPFFYGFHLGPDVPADDLYQMLELIEENSEELVQADGAFRQIHEDIAEMQRRGVAASGGAVPVHPGLAEFMRDRGVWNEDWDDWVYDG